MTYDSKSEPEVVTRLALFANSKSRIKTAKAAAAAVGRKVMISSFKLGV